MNHKLVVDMKFIILILKVPQATPTATPASNNRIEGIKHFRYNTIPRKISSLSIIDS